MLDSIDEIDSNKSTFYELLGGDQTGAANIKVLVNTFYEIMDADPKAAIIRKLHPTDLISSREKLTLFLTGWTGGPQLYIERYGHPMLRKRHMPFKIGEGERDQWIYCMINAMHQLEYDEELMKNLATQLYGVADFMRNQ